jgi:hypothetical protein
MAFSYYRTITIDKTKVPNTNQTNFPVLVSGTYTYLKTVGNGGSVQNANGYDVGFYSDSALTTKLKWQTQKYTASTGEVVYWVKVPTVSTSVDTVIYMAYGDASISTDQSDSTNVWDTNFQAVYHMDESSLGTGGATVSDSTSNARNMVTAVSGTGDVQPATGKIGGGIAITGSNQYQGGYITNSSNSGLGSGTSLTVECWVSFPSSRSYDAGYNFFVQRTTSYPYYTAGLRVDSTNNGVAGSFDDNSGNHYTTTRAAVSLNTLYYVVTTYDGSTVKTYLNGALAYSTSASFSIGADAPFYVGYSPAEGFRYTEMTIDELRLSNSTRDVNWITTGYNNQNSPSTFYTVGSEVVVGASFIAKVFRFVRQAVNRASTY